MCLCTQSLPTSSLPGRRCFDSWEEYCPGSKALLDFSRIRPDVACWLLPEKSQEPSWMPKESLSQQLWDSTPMPLTTSTFPPQDFRHQFIAQWNKLNLDVLLCPMLGPALGIGYPAKLSGRGLAGDSAVPVSMSSLPPPLSSLGCWPAAGRAQLLGQLQPSHGVPLEQPPGAVGAKGLISIPQPVQVPHFPVQVPH